jgi:hypothetical protein
LPVGRRRAVRDAHEGWRQSAHTSIVTSLPPPRSR